MRKRFGNPLFVIFLLYTLFVILTEWINLCFELLGYTLHIGIAEIISVLLILILFFWIKKNGEFESININVEFILGIVIISSFGVMMSVYPDQSYDTYNYHLIAQNPHFENYFVEDYGYGNFQVWGFRLPDRLFYYFRYVFGFRIGTILNPIILVISFSQLYKLLEWIFTTLINDSNKYQRIACNKLLWSLSILLPLDAIFMCGTYYVDVFAVPISLEIIRLLLTENKKQNTIDVAYFALLNGIIVGFKLTNIIYAIPFVLVFIFKNIQDIKVKEWGLSIIFGFFPFLDYLIFNYLCTGNPVFPYYNTIFKSQYFADINFKDTRWGGETVFEKTFWVLYAAFNPEYRQSEIYDYKPATLIVGLIGTVILIGIYICKKKINSEKEIKNVYNMLFIITLVSSFLWAFISGYSRYFVFGKILWGIMAYWFITYISKNYDELGQIVSMICSIFVITCLFMNVKLSIDGRNWSWTAFSPNTFKEQIQYVFADRDITSDYNVDVDMFILTNQEIMGVAELINDKIYMINTNYPSKDADKFKKLCNEKVSEASTVYDIHKRSLSDISNYIEILNSLNLYVNSFSSIKVGAGNYVLVNVDNGGVQGKSNQIWTSDEGVLKIDTNLVKKEGVLSFIAGRYYNWEDFDTAILKVFEISEDKIETEIASVDIDNIEILNYRIPLSFSSDNLVVRLYNSAGEVMSTDEINKIFVVNWSLN